MHARPRLRPVQIFVCTNRRAVDDPLGAGCGARGEAVHAALKSGVARRGGWSKVWLATSGCLGVCPKRGCTIAAFPAGYVDEVEPTDADAILNALAV